MHTTHNHLYGYFPGLLGLANINGVTWLQQCQGKQLHNAGVICFTARCPYWCSMPKQQWTRCTRLQQNSGENPSMHTGDIVETRRRWYFSHIWSCYDLEPKPNQLLFVSSCTADKSLVKIHQCLYHGHHWSNIPDGRTHGRTDGRTTWKNKAFGTPLQWWW